MRTVTLALVKSVLACAVALAAVAQDDPVARTAKITYVSGASVYVDAGESQGVTVGTRLTVDGTDLVLVVTEVSRSRAVARIESGDPSVAVVGFEVRFVPLVAPVTVAAGSTKVASEDGRTRAPSGVHGRIGVRYMTSRDGLNEAAEYSSPALDVRLDAPSMFGSAWNAHLDVRARRVSQTGSAGESIDDDRSRVYRAAVGWDRPGPGFRVAAGRQVSPELANVSMFDGVAASWDGERWGAGGFAGTQPDPVDWGFSSEIAEAGGWYGIRSRVGAERRWGLNVGAVASRADGDVNREFVFLQGRYTGARLHGYFVQEVDVNRDWKSDEAGESTIEPTSTFLSLRFKASEAIDLNAGFDNRRNVRLYRDRVTPVTAFDDSFRRGAWAGLSARAGRHLRFAVSGRQSSGGTAGDAVSYSGSVAVVRLTRLGIAVSGRATRWESDRLEGWLYLGSVSIDPVPGFGLSLQAGVRDETSLLNPALDDEVTWVGLDADIDLPGNLWATVSFERSEGDFEEVDLLYATLAWRF